MSFTRYTMIYIDIFHSLTLTGPHPMSIALQYTVSTSRLKVLSFPPVSRRLRCESNTTLEFLVWVVYPRRHIYIPIDDDRYAYSIHMYVYIYIKAEKHHVQVALIACRQYKLAYMNELPHTHTIWYIMGELGPLWTFSGVKLVGFITLLWNVYVSSSLQSPEAKTVPNINHTTLHVSHSL